MNIEVWKDIENYPYYMVSSFGNILSKGRVVTIKQSYFDREYKRDPSIMKLTINKYGYSKVYLEKGGEDTYRKTLSVHRLVAEAFIPNPENKPQVNHINGIKTDNRVENLEWCTNKENQKHAYQTGLNKPKFGENNPFSKTTKQQALEIKRLLSLNKYSCPKIGDMVGVSKHVVFDIKRNRTWVNV